MKLSALVLGCIFILYGNSSLQCVEPIQFSNENIPSLSLTEISHGDLNSNISSMFYIERGEHYLSLGEFDKAINDLHKGYELNLSAQISRIEVEFRSLFAMMLAYTCLGEENTAVKISNYLQNLLDNWKCKDCVEIQLCQDESYVIGPENEPYDGWCEETVTATAAALKGVVRGSRLNLAAKESIIFTIDKLQIQALKCCARGGLWKGCVGPLAKKLYEWKVLDLPPDPAWD